MRFRMTLKPWPVAKPCCTRTFHRTKCTPCTGEFLLDSSPPTQIPRVHVCSSRSRLTMIPCKGCSMPTSPTGIPRNASHISMLVMNTHMLRSDSTSSLWHGIIGTLLYAACVSPSCALFDWASSVASSVAVGDEITLPSLPVGLACECAGAESRSSRSAPSSITSMAGRERLSAFVDLCRMWSA